MRKEWAIKECGTDQLMITAMTHLGSLSLLKKIQVRYPERRFYIVKRGELI